MKLMEKNKTKYRDHGEEYIILVGGLNKYTSYVTLQEFKSNNTYIVICNSLTSTQTCATKIS